MAEGLLRHFGGSQVEVFSAGTRPTRVHPTAVKVMAHMGIDVTQQRAKAIDVFQGQTFDYVVTVCDRAREVCPTFPGNPQLIHWSLRDPADDTDSEPAQYLAFEQTAQVLSKRIHFLLLAIYAKGD